MPAARAAAVCTGRRTSSTGTNVINQLRPAGDAFRAGHAVAQPRVDNASEFCPKSFMTPAAVALLGNVGVSVFKDAITQRLNVRRAELAAAKATLEELDDAYRHAIRLLTIFLHEAYENITRFRLIASIRGNFAPCSLSAADAVFPEL